MIALFIVGSPGAGKTTLARQLLPPDPYLIQKPKWTVGERMCAAGHYTGGTFDGADTVPYNGVAAALAYWHVHLLPKLEWTLFDGDRFSHEGTLLDLRPFCARLVCVYMKADEALLDQRRRERGSTQNATWMKGRQTKAQNFAFRFPDADRLVVDASFPTLGLATQIIDTFGLT